MSCRAGIEQNARVSSMKPDSRLNPAISVTDSWKRRIATGAVQEPPRRAGVHGGVEAGQRGDLAGVGVRVHGEQHEVQVGVGAVPGEQRAQRVGELGADRDVVPGVRAVPGERVRVVVAAHARVQRHDQPVVAGHPGHLQDHVPAERGRLGLGHRPGQRRPVDAVRFGGLQRRGHRVGVAVIRGHRAVRDEVPAALAPAPRRIRRSRRRRCPPPRRVASPRRPSPGVAGSR